MFVDPLNICKRHERIENILRVLYFDVAGASGSTRFSAFSRIQNHFLIFFIVSSVIPI